MFLILCSVLERLPTFCSGEIAFFSKKKLSIFSSRDVAKMFLWQSCLCSILKNCPPHPSIPPRVCKLTACVCRTQTLPGKGNHFLNWKWNIIFWWTPCEKKTIFFVLKIKKNTLLISREPKLKIRQGAERFWKEKMMDRHCFVWMILFCLSMLFYCVCACVSFDLFIITSRSFC